MFKVANFVANATFIERNKETIRKKLARALISWGGRKTSSTLSQFHYLASYVIPDGHILADYKLIVLKRGFGALHRSTPTPVPQLCSGMTDIQ